MMLSKKTCVLGIFLILALVVGGDYNLVIIHTNDVHARVGETDTYSNLCDADDIAANTCYAGVARRLTKIKEVREENPYVLLLDGGDEFQGTVWFTYYHGIEASFFMNQLGYDALALGNHEFDRGVAGLVPFLKNATFPVLSANIDASQEPLIRDYIRPSVVKTVGGHKIAIIGYTLHDLPIYVSPDGIANLVMRDEVVAVRAEARRVIAENPGLNKIIALGHAGHEMDKKIAREVDEVDIVVGGHSNTFLYTGQPPPSREQALDEYPVVVDKKSGGKALVVMAYAYGKYIGNLSVVFDDNGTVESWAGNPILLDSTITQDPVLLEEVLRWQAPLENYTKQEVGQTYVHLEGDAAICRRRECTLGNLFAEALVYSVLRAPAAGTWTHAPVAFWNAGGIRAPISQGPISLGDILTCLPYSNEIEVLELKGVTLLEIFEHSASKLTEVSAAGRFLQVSGFRVTYDISKEPYSRVAEVWLRCAECTVPSYQPLDPAQTYTVITSSFLYNGGDGYSMIEKGTLTRENIGTIDSTVLQKYIEQHSPIINGLEGRITILNGTEGAQSCTSGGSSYDWKPAMFLVFMFLSLL